MDTSFAPMAPRKEHNPSGMARTSMIILPSLRQPRASSFSSLWDSAHAVSTWQILMDPTSLKFHSPHKILKVSKPSSIAPRLLSQATALFSDRGYLRLSRIGSFQLLERNRGL